MCVYLIHSNKETLQLSCACNFKQGQSSCYVAEVLQLLSVDIKKEVLKHCTHHCIALLHHDDLRNHRQPIMPSLETATSPLTASRRR